MWISFAIAAFTALWLGVMLLQDGLHGVSVLMVLAGFGRWLYTRMDAFVLRVHGARRLHFEEAPRLYTLLAHLSIAARIPSPRLYVMRREQPNAFCLGAGPRAAHLVLTSAALEELDEAELCALVAHELAHIARGHTRRATLVAALVAMMARCAKRAGWRGGTSGRFARFADRMGAPLERDFIADRDAAGLLGEAQDLAALLGRLKAHAPWSGPRALSDAGLGFTVPAGDETWERALDERIHRLQRVADEQHTRRAKPILRRSLHRGSRFHPRVEVPGRRTRVHPLRGKRLTRMDGGSRSGPRLPPGSPRGTHPPDRTGGPPAASGPA
ncbi:M48 family metalloprotease [Corallococcus sp. BB11-1]|uniref:M48 family metalloprotease n=1 Tax=Corallococcus sp. BB11-1 TaxID=2996783 RepID=UPI00226F531C|nr:M48 family metalloprotease [Corallococcus sp. BB11-1]MCY1036115.1 M48 family metalloprotease [Corallococcus sp. BB11-1]